MAVRDIDRGMKRLRRTMKRGNGLKAVAGIQGSEAQVSRGDFGQSNIDIAVFHEFGTRSVTERSFVRATFDRKRSGYKRLMDKAVQRGLDGLAMDRAFGRLALRMAADMQQTINESIGLEPLADATVRSRRRARGIAGAGGVERPLLDTGQLKRSITGIVRKG